MFLFTSSLIHRIVCAQDNEDIKAQAGEVGLLRRDAFDI